MQWTFVVQALHWHSEVPPPARSRQLLAPHVSRWPILGFCVGARQYSVSVGPMCDFMGLGPGMDEARCDEALGGSKAH